MPIPKARLLDVSEAGPHIRDSVRIPLSDLGARQHELPPRTEHLAVADTGTDAASAVAWLTAAGWQATLTEAFELGEPGILRLWEPNGFLAEVAPQLRPGRALDLGCGSGRSAVYLASLGWEVVAVDHLPDAIEMARDLERRYLAEPVVSWIAGDVDDYSDAHGFDLVTSFFFLDRDQLVRRVNELRSGGSLVVETFTAEHRAKFGRPREAFVVQHGELERLLRELEVLVCEQAWRPDGRHTVRYQGRRP